MSKVIVFSCRKSLPLLPKFVQRMTNFEENFIFPRKPEIIVRFCGNRSRFWDVKPTDPQDTAKTNCEWYNRLALNGNLRTNEKP